MASELETCAAAFVRIKGKEVFTETEFKMEVTLNLKWVSAKEADRLVRILLAENIVCKSNGYLKISKDLSAVRVPIAYRPSEDLKKSLSGTVAVKTPVSVSDKPLDLFEEMMGIAVENGIQKGKFVSECNVLRKKLGIDTCVAGLLLLRDSGVDIGKLKGRAYARVLGK